MKRGHKVLGAGLVVLLVVASFAFRYSSRPRILGNLSAADSKQIQKMVWAELKETERPALEWDSLKHPKYCVGGFARYSRLHILWIQVKTSDYVRVVIGLNTNTVAADGWDFMVKRDSPSNSWTITGSAYWGDPAVAPSDFRIPAQL